MTNNILVEINEKERRKEKKKSFEINGATLDD